MYQIVSCEQMKYIENRTEAMGISMENLMENAGKAVYANIAEKVGFSGRKVICLCGVGNNGGDSLIVASLAHMAGAKVMVVLADEPVRSPLTLHLVEKVKELGIKIFSAKDHSTQIGSALEDVDIIIDGVYGTGFKGELPSVIDELFIAVNNSAGAVFSIDIPSGTQCDSGMAAKNSIKADFTLALDSAKLCHMLPTTKDNCGQIEVIDIGIPEKAREDNYTSPKIMNKEIAKSFMPVRNDFTHKFDFGKLVNIAGSDRYMGAAILSCQGALYSGAGYVTLISTANVCNAVASHNPEVTYIQLDSTEDKCMNLKSFNNNKLLGDYSDVVLMGCGMGKARHSYETLLWVLANRKHPLVIDADGINALSGKTPLLKDAKCPIVITPHYREMANLLGCTVSDVERDPISLAHKLAVTAEITVVLKGPNTVIAGADGSLYINCGCNSGMSKAGSGDMLAGIIAGLICQGGDPTQMAALGVYIHSQAGRLTAKRLSPFTMQPSDLKEEIGKVFLSLSK